MRVAEMQLFFSFLTLKFGKVGGGIAIFVDYNA